MGIPMGRPRGRPLGIPTGRPMGIPIGCPMGIPMGRPAGIPIGIPMGIPMGQAGQKSVPFQSGLCHGENLFCSNPFHVMGKILSNPSRSMWKSVPFHEICSGPWAKSVPFHEV